MRARRRSRAALTIVVCIGDSITAGSPLWDPDPVVRAGISKPETKTNTILVSVLLIVFIGMQFTFTSLQPFREDKHPVALENRPESGQTNRMVSDTAKSIAENRSLSKRIN